MEISGELMCCAHWNYRGISEFPDGLMLGSSPVTDLYLKGNNIKELPNEDRPDLRLIKNVYLCENFIEEFPVEAWRSFSSLRHLDLSGNLIVKIPDDICRLRNLQSLILDDNRLRWLPVGLQNMKSLKHFSVNDNLLCWLPQSIGANHYSCHVSFWRNRTLRHVPFAVWLHVLKDSQIKPTAKLCFLDNTEWFPYTVDESMKNSVKICNGRIELIIPHYIYQIENVSKASPASLLELSLRKFYGVRNKYSNNSAIRLPKHIEDVLLRGPTTTCDYSKCNKSLFGYGILIICIRNVGHEINQILTTSFFCSKICFDLWQNLYKTTPLSWTPT